MKKILVIIFTLLLVSCSDASNNKLKVAVSIVPEEAFVKAVAGDLVDVVVMIPPGYSPANYQPSPKEMADLDESILYFHIDVAAEQNILEGIQNNDVELIDLADAVDDVYPPRYFEENVVEESHDGEDDHDHTGRDPHIWLSPKRVIVMVEKIEEELIKIDPDNKAVYEKNAKDYIDTIKALDQEIKETLSDTKTDTFLIYHPSYGYFADDYGLKMIAIEDEGKDATIQGMESIIEFALQNEIHVIFYQEEFDNQQAEIIAKEIDGVTVQVSPLSGDYIESLKHVVEELKNILK
ncbi:MAG: zinc ABC transporter substrate-binding protein [Clostridia bacterium]|nr:zinc ABC transporter substrate-binding protein [Clostridia bacterium]